MGPMHSGGRSEKESLTSIEGATITTADEFAKYYNSKKKSYPYSGNSEAPTIEKFAQIYIEECNAEGIRAEVAFCQAMKETGWLQFGGDVKQISITSPESVRQAEENRDIVSALSGQGSGRMCST